MEFGAFNLPSVVGSVKYFLNGNLLAIRDDAPYSLCGHNGTDYFSCYLDDGEYELTAVAYENARGRGFQYPALNFNFTLITSAQGRGRYELALG